MTLSPINQRRWQTFKNSKRGSYSAVLLLVLFTFSLFAEFIANDKPILVSYDNSLYLPSFIAYPEVVFGGDFETEADYTDPYVVELIDNKGWMLWPLIRYSYDTHIANLPTPAPSPPDSNNWLGTDDQARDVLARIIYGFRISMLFAIALTIGSSVIGVMVGAVQGYYGGKIDLVGQRFLEIWGGLPVLFLLIILSRDQAPRASPPKNAPITASSAGISCPSP